MANRRFRRRAITRGMKRGLLWIQDSFLFQPNQVDNLNTNRAVSLEMISPSLLSPLGGQGLFTESEGWTLTRIIGFLEITAINDLPTLTSVGWRWNFGVYQGADTLQNASTNMIETPDGAEIDWLHVTGAHLSAHSVLDFVPPWINQELYTKDFDIRVQRKLRGGGKFAASGTYDTGAIFAYFGVISENLAVDETLDISARFTWRMLLRKPGR